MTWKDDGRRRGVRLLRYRHNILLTWMLALYARARIPCNDEAAGRVAKLLFRVKDILVYLILRISMHDYYR